MGKGKVGRPKKEIEPELVYKLAQIQCTIEEIASVVGVNASTISRNFAGEIAKGRAEGKISLRRSQFKLSENNATMAIWLGKNWLGQSDNPTTGDPVERSQGMANMIKQLKEKVFGTAPKTD